MAATDAISRINDWSREPGADTERLESVSDHHDIDDDSLEIYATKVMNKTDLEMVINEVNSLDTSKRSDESEVSGAILGSWHTTPSPK